MEKPIIQRLAQEQLGGIPQDIIRKNIGMCNEVYELRFPTESYILRMNRDKGLLYGTHKNLPLFQQLGIKTPDIIAEDYSKTTYPFCYQIQTLIPGKDLGLVIEQLSETQLRDIARAVSDIFDKFNRLPTQNSFGGIRGQDEDEQESMLSIFAQRRSTIHDRNQHSQVISSEILDIYDQAIDSISTYLSQVQAKIYYDDISAKNVMIHQGQFSGLVDLDFLSKGDYLEAIGAILACWEDLPLGRLYVEEIIRLQHLSPPQERVVEVYAILHLILWMSEAGIRFNTNSSAKIDWTEIERKKAMILRLYHSDRSISSV